VIHLETAQGGKEGFRAEITGTLIADLKTRSSQEFETEPVSFRITLERDNGCLPFGSSTPCLKMGEAKRRRFDLEQKQTTDAKDL